MLLRQGKSIAVVLTVLVLLILFAQSIVVAWKSNELRALKWSMKTQIIRASATEDLISFSFSHAAWMNFYKPDPTEFVMDGIYYDIAKVESTSEGVNVSCLKDEKEGQCKAKLKRWLKDEHSPYHKAQKSLRDFIKVLKFFNSPQKLSFVVSSVLKHVISVNDGLVVKGFHSLVTGPPWLD
jgi:hypothetical protein